MYTAEPRALIKECPQPPCFYPGDATLCLYSDNKAQQYNKVKNLQYFHQIFQTLRDCKNHSTQVLHSTTQCTS